MEILDKLCQELGCAPEDILVGISISKKIRLSKSMEEMAAKANSGIERVQWLISSRAQLVSMGKDEVPTWSEIEAAFKGP